MRARPGMAATVYAFLGLHGCNRGQPIATEPWPAHGIVEFGEATGAYVDTTAKPTRMRPIVHG